jgi:hypothetical protein
VLSSERLRELAAWLRDTAETRNRPVDEADTHAVEDEDSEDEDDELGQVDESEFDAGDPLAERPETDDEAVDEVDDGPDPRNQPQLGDDEEEDTL